MTFQSVNRHLILRISITAVALVSIGLLLGTLEASSQHDVLVTVTPTSETATTPRLVRVTTGASQELVVSWDAPDGDDGSLITGYKVQWKSGTEDYDGTASSNRQAVLVGGDRLTYTIARLTNGTDYTVRVIAYNGLGDGPASTEVTAAPEAPNIVVILVGDLGYADAGFSASTVNKALVMELARCEYVQNRENVIAVGNSGTGKTHVALGLGLAACRKGCPWASPPPPPWSTS